MWPTDYRKDETGVWIRDGHAAFNYSDGDEVEERILKHVLEAEDVSVASDDLQKQMVDWPSEYHFSPLRANLLSPFHFERFSNILEIGPGCGAITRQLGEGGTESRILALEGSMRRAEITRARCRDLDNVEVCCDSFTDFTTDERFDLITFIGVLEYSPSFFDGADPIQAALRKAKELLKEGGVLVVAIENQLGLKYFNGCPEDHNGKAFFGINDEYLDGPVKTFGKRRLERLIASVGFKQAEFVYPFPDYKLPRLLLREEAFTNDAFDIAHLLGQFPARGYGKPTDKLFRESRAWKLLAENGLIRDFSNSFLVFASSGDTTLKDFTDNWMGRSFSGQRRKRYLARNDFSGDNGRVLVDKSLSYPGEEQDSSTDDVVIQHVGKEDYQEGVPYGYLLLDRVTEEKPVESFIEYLRPWVERLSKESFEEGDEAGRNLLLPGTFYDCIPINLIADSKDELAVIDQEWEITKELELGFILFRGILGTISTNLDFFEQTGLFDNESVLDILTRIFEAFDIPFNDEIYRQYLYKEVNIQYELVPYHGEKREFLGIWESFFAEKRSKRSTLSDLVGTVSVRHYEFLSQQYDFWHHEGKKLLGEIKQLDEELQRRTEKLGECEEDRADVVLKVHQRNATISAIHNSFSWKLTEPLRMVGYLIRGDVERAGSSLKQIKNSIIGFLQSIPRGLLVLLKKVKSTDSTANGAALESIVQERCRITSTQSFSDQLTASHPEKLPSVDICAVTYNSEKWIDGFVESLLDLDYPKSNLNIHFVDNSSQDGTVGKLEKVVELLQNAGCRAAVHRQENRGFGAGHNVAVRAGSAPYCLISNVDLVFDCKALRNVVTVAMADNERAAAWELRQRPYEHPKYYDPVTGLTNWNSHACILFRRSALEAVGGYDERLFMYGEDVELSYRLRRSGSLLRYCPHAVVDHFTYEHADQVKPSQYKGSTFANLYLRLKYGNWGDIAAIPFLAAELLLAPKPFNGARRTTTKNLVRLMAAAPHTVLSRKKVEKEVFFPFRTWDYELAREGAFVTGPSLPSDLPLISIITRTYQGRSLYLRQAMLSVAHQTYPNIEHIIVEDGGDTLKSVVAQTGALTGRQVRFIETEKNGRSAAGNVGLQEAQGKYCLFLDDDDLLFSDHVELLFGSLHENPDAVASYSFAWEVMTDASDIENGKYRELTYEVPAVLQDEYSFKTLNEHNLWAIQSILFERRLYEERGGFDVDLDVLEDWVLWICYGYNNEIIRVPKVTSLFRTPLDGKLRDQRQKIIDEGYEPARARAKERIETFKNRTMNGTEQQPV